MSSGDLAVEGIKVHGREEPLPCHNLGLLKWIRRRRVAPFSLDLDRRVRGPAEKRALHVPKAFLFLSIREPAKDALAVRSQTQPYGSIFFFFNETPDALFLKRPGSVAN
jgi:hypothetical protein